MFDGAHVHRLEAKHEPTHVNLDVNRGGGSAAMFRLYFYIPLAAMAALCISHPQDPCSTTMRPDLLLRLLVLRATAPSAIARVQIAQIFLGLPAQSGDPRFVQQNPRMVRIRTFRITYICTCPLSGLLNCFFTFRYFTKFMDLIHSLNHVDWSVLSPIHTHSLQRHVGQLKEATICAMAHMLTANIDSGLTHAIGKLSTRCMYIVV